MKVAILAGGMGTRLAEETETKPKPMVEIGGHPILWHIMMHYAHFDFRHFVVALGYMGDLIRRYMLDRCSPDADLTVRPDWTVELIDTGLHTATGGRIKRLEPHLGDETFMLTWGDGVSDVDLPRLLAFHRAHGRLATLTAVKPPARFGHIELRGNQVVEYSEKPQTREGWINGAFFVLEPAVFEYIESDEMPFEHAPLERLAADGQLMAYRHEGFWQCMDTLRDKRQLNELWAAGNAPWKLWSP